MPRLQYRKNGELYICKYGWEIVVEGKGVFPFDMLRYDKCYPVFESEATMMRHDSFPYDRKSQVTLKTKNDSVTPRRWQSFLWNIVQLYPLDKDGRRQYGVGIISLIDSHDPELYALPCYLNADDSIRS